MSQEGVCSDETGKNKQFGLTEDQMRKLSVNSDIVDAIHDVFQEMDGDGNGTLSEFELGDAMTALSVSWTEEELQNLMHKIDTNGDGEIDFFEFCQMISSKMKIRDSSKDLRKAFDAFDKDKDGTITTEELRMELESLGEHLSKEEIDQMMEEADENHDGQIDFAEFCKIWTSQDNIPYREPEKDASEEKNKEPVTKFKLSGMENGKSNVKDSDVDEAEENKKIKGWTEDFKALAGDENNFITKEDLEKYWQRANKNPSKEDVNAVCKAIQLADKDGDAKISLKEFIDIQKEAETAPFFTEDSQVELIEALKCFDTNGDGTVSREELRGILPDYMYDNEVLEDLFKSVDKNNDGKLSIAELAAILTETLK